METRAFDAAMIAKSIPDLLAYLDITLLVGISSIVLGSALGMLLLLKERAAAQKRTLALINCRDTVKQVLEIACFNKMFVIR
mgnify:CR=1 FL=1